jgi:hypothetical protein
MLASYEVDFGPLDSRYRSADDVISLRAQICGLSEQTVGRGDKQIFGCAPAQDVNHVWLFHWTFWCLHLILKVVAIVLQQLRCFDSQHHGQKWYGTRIQCA